LCLLRKAPQTNSHVRGIHCVFCVFDISGPDSIDQHAFQDVPEVGAAPDMIYDDLPSNPDYLDVSFGTAAGLRELDDDDLDMDDQSRSEQMDSTDSPSHSADNGVVSSVGGETIRLLDPVGLHVVENFFNTLPALVESSPQ
jgi:autophagy-related protein 2